eukprot:CAMPEP_0194599810 /NCGR_PEP_ID=MMETSP0292-20121207/27907_1 /TAXON_ID=39354 /ORGANISM="Heterosigma akashiwo, Strain CCMP2393" /LENGTH=62 /DNA_ID=CAMNT_0039461195 /DNA_START=39 /DNA_END=227 /DNA_ORIENTATION=+
MGYLAACAPDPKRPVPDQVVPAVMQHRGCDDDKLALPIINGDNNQIRSGKVAVGNPYYDHTF